MKRPPSITSQSPAVAIDARLRCRCSVYRLPDMPQVKVVLCLKDGCDCADPLPAALRILRLKIRANDGAKGQYESNSVVLTRSSSSGRGRYVIKKHAWNDCQTRKKLFERSHSISIFSHTLHSSFVIIHLSCVFVIATLVYVTLPPCPRSLRARPRILAIKHHSSC